MTLKLVTTSDNQILKEEQNCFEIGSFILLGTFFAKSAIQNLNISQFYPLSGWIKQSWIQYCPSKPSPIVSSYVGCAYYIV